MAAAKTRRKQTENDNYRWRIWEQPAKRWRQQSNVGEQKVDEGLTDDVKESRLGNPDKDKCLTMVEMEKEPLMLWSLLAGIRSQD